MIFFVDHFYTEASCGFMLEGAPGTAYSFLEIDSVGPVPTEKRKLYKASMKIEERIASRNPIVRQIPIECVKWGSLSSFAFICRTDADCGQWVCISEPGYSHGICSKP
jgi:hypothetical protein